MRAAKHHGSRELALAWLVLTLHDMRIATPIAALLFAACGVATPPDEPTLDPRVTVLPDITGMVITPHAIEVPRAGNGSLAALAPGDIVISASGEGLLRRVEAVGGDAARIVIGTSEAELGDALVDAQIATSLGGEGKADTHQLAPIQLTLRDKLLLDNEAITARLVEGTLRMEPALDLDLSIAERSLQNFEMVMRGRVTGSLEIAVDAKDIAVGPEITLWESPPATFYQQLGPVPVVETVTSSVVLRLEATARGHGILRVSAEAIAEMAGGLRYTPERGWHKVSQLQLSVAGEEPQASVGLDEIGVRATLAARVDVRLYGLAGPYVAAGPHVKVARDVVNNEWDTAAGFQGRTGGGFKLWRLNVPAMPSFELFNLAREIL